MGLNKNQNSGNFNDEVVDMSNYATKSDLETKVTKEANKSLVDNTLIDKLEDLENYDDSLVREEINSINSQLATIENEKIDYININKYSNMVVDNDWTKAISQAISDVKPGSTLFFPYGTYNHTGITITKPINIVGTGKYETKLVNIGSGDSITINKECGRGVIRDIAIFGNGTGADCCNATAKKGVVFGSNTGLWEFKHVWMRGHSDYYFYACDVGCVNNVYVTQCELEWGGGSCIRFYQTDSLNQINAIHIDKTNISGFKGNGIELWGQSISVSTCAIQACGGYGIELKCDSDAKSLGHIESLSIRDNYFELCNKGFINISTCYTPHARYINGLSIINNYGSYSKLNDDFDASNTYLVTINTPDYSNNLSTLSGLFYFGNSFRTNGIAKGVVYANGNLSSYNYIYKSSVGTETKETEFRDYVGLGRAKLGGFLYANEKTLYGKNHCLSHDYNMNESTNITKSDKLYFDFPGNIRDLSSISFNISTDSTCRRVCLFVEKDGEEIAISNWYGGGSETCVKEDIRLGYSDSIYTKIGIDILFYQDDDNDGTKFTYCNISNLKYT